MGIVISSKLPTCHFELLTVISIELPIVISSERSESRNLKHVLWKNA